MLRDHLVDDSIFHRFFGGEDKISVGVGVDLLDLAGGEAHRDQQVVVHLGLVTFDVDAVAPIGVVLSALAVLWLALVWMFCLRSRREMAILRAVGARPGHVFVLLVSEATAIAAAGAVAGIVLINLLFVMIAGVVQSRYGLTLASGGLSLTDILTGVVVITSGAVMGIMPARRALKNALADGLTVKL